MLVTGLTMALAFAGPARGQDEPVLPEPALPTASVPETPEVEATPIDPVPPSVPELPTPSVPEPPVMPDVSDAPATISVTEDDAGNVDVSVHVLTPVETTTTSEDTGDPALVSAQPTGSITPTQDTHEAAQQDETTAPPPAGTNVNVSVRVLSPGNDEPVGQVNSSGTEGDVADQQDKSPTGGSTPLDTTAEAEKPAESAEQYHGMNSQSSATGNSESDAWSWTWYLGMDCDGNVLSESVESGLPSSLEWTWTWDWEWACSSPRGPPPVEVVTAEAPSANGPGATAPSAEGDHQSPAEAEQPDAEPWQLIWTFTFCGQTVSAPLTIAHSTPLEWTWAWTWTWTCETEAAEAPPHDGPLPPPPSPLPAGSAAGNPGTTNRIQSPGEAVIASEGSVGVAISLSLPEISVLVTPFFTSHTTPFGHVTVDASLVHLTPDELATIVSALPLPPSRSPTVRPARPRMQVRVLVTPSGTATPSSAPARSHESPPGVRWSAPTGDTTGTAERPAKSAPERRGGGESRRNPAPPPLLPPASGTAPAGVSGGAGSGGATGTAALTGFLIVFAPGVGRRIRAARGLRPRARYGTAIDRPG